MLVIEPTADANAWTYALPPEMTLNDCIAQAARQLDAAGLAFGHGTTNAFDEAAWLVLWRLGLPLDTDLSSDNSSKKMALAQSDIDQIATLINERISTRKPAAYLTHEAWLQGLSFYVDERVIIPRSLLAEVLMSENLDYWLSDTTERVLDLCTGNGSLAIIAAVVYPDVKVQAADICPKALEVARINIDRHGLHDRISLRQCDGIPKTGSHYDLILCNPPYVNAQSMALLPPEYRAEPPIALNGNQAGGTDGMDFIRQLLRDAPAQMTQDALLVLEIGNERAHFEAAFPTLEVVWLETSAGEDQVLLLTRDKLLGLRGPNP